MPSQEATTNPRDVMTQMITGYWVSSSLGVVARLGVAEELAGGPKAVGAIAAAVGANPDVLFRLMRALASVGVFEQPERGVFALTPLGELMRSGVADSLRWMAVSLVEPCQWLPWGRALDVAKTGRSQAKEALGGLDVWSYYDEHPEQLVAFARAMTDHSQAACGPVSEAYDFTRFSKIVDVGGSHGGLLDAVLGKAPDAAGVLFDRASVLEGADLATLANGDRIEAVGGDFFESVPAGGDAYMMKHIVHDWDDERALALLRNVRRVIPKEGRLLIVELVLSDESPPFVPWLDVHMLLLQDGKERSAEEFGALVGQAGFELERIVPTANPVSIVEASPI
jgi:hypothetical protein